MNSFLFISLSNTIVFFITYCFFYLKLRNDNDIEIQFKKDFLLTITILWALITTYLFLFN